LNRVRSERPSVMASHEVRIGSKVLSSDNKDVGEVSRLVIAPDTKLVASLIVSHMAGGERLVDVDLIAATDQGAVRLSILASEAAHLPPFVHETVTHVSDWRNIAFGGGPVTSMGNVSGPVAYGPGSYAAPATQPFFMTAPIGNIVTETVSDVPEGDVAVGKGTEVRGSDGKAIGHIHDVVYDDNDEITAFVVQSGHIFHKQAEVPISTVAGIAHDHLRLNLTADEAKTQYGN
jgi:sporulation protein YlmC with PRC-barrel domain